MRFFWLVWQARRRTSSPWCLWKAGRKTSIRAVSSWSNQQRCRGQLKGRSSSSKRTGNDVAATSSNVELSSSSISDVSEDWTLDSCPLDGRWRRQLLHFLLSPRTRFGIHHFLLLPRTAEGGSNSTEHRREPTITISNRNNRETVCSEIEIQNALSTEITTEADKDKGDDVIKREVYIMGYDVTLLPPRNHLKGVIDLSRPAICPRDYQLPFRS